MKNKLRTRAWTLPGKRQLIRSKFMSPESHTKRWLNITIKMLTHKPDSNIVESDEGFSVEINARGTITYRERFKKITVYTDIIPNSSYTTLFRYQFKKWDPPFGMFPINKSHQEQIISRVEEASKLRKWECKFE